MSQVDLSKNKMRAWEKKWDKVGAGVEPVTPCTSRGKDGQNHD